MQAQLWEHICNQVCKNMFQNFSTVQHLLLNKYSYVTYVLKVASLYIYSLINAYKIIGDCKAAGQSVSQKLYVIK
jgi:hypothetical protein